jgi:hypothetical protein
VVTITPGEVIAKSKTYVENLIENLLLWIASHRSYGVQPTREEYRSWYEKLTIASLMLQEHLKEDSCCGAKGDPP